MKSNIARTIFFAILLLSLAAAASAGDGHACSAAKLAGAWGFSWTGTLIIANSPFPAAAVGTSISDADGNISGTLTSSIGGTVSQDTMTGTTTVNPDCTGTLTVTILGAVTRTATWDMVFDDNGSESRSIMTSLVISGYPAVKPVVTMISKKLFSPPGIGQ